MAPLVPGRLSIGLPTYNGARFLRATLESLLAQDYADFELIISDNASTDETGEIARAFAERDTRLSYHRAAENFGAVENFNRVAALATGEFFVWAGDHDLWEPSYFSRCLEVLRNDPAVVLAYARSCSIDEEGRVLAAVMPDDIDTRGREAAARYREIVWRLDICNMFHGVMRTEALRRTAPLVRVWGVDHVFLAELAWLGAVAQRPEVLFYRRRNRPPEQPEEQKRRVAMALDPAAPAATRDDTFERQFSRLGVELRAMLRRQVPNPRRRLHADLTTRVAMHNRWGVPYTRSCFFDTYLNKFLYGAGLVRWLR